jgi:folate-binding protein YgfZ
MISHLSKLGLIKITGNDAETFLQGQFTNDVRQVTDTHSQLSAICSPKGRVIVNFRIFKRDDAYYLLLPKDCLATTLKRLQMYVLRAKAKLEDASDNLFPIGIAGSNSTQILTDCLGFAPPTKINASLTINNITVLKVPDNEARYIVLTEISDNISACEEKIIDESKWQLLDILAGLPQIVPATNEAFVPQMLNYDILDGISFKKGCYTGQEIVARMQYLGTLKRRMYLAKIETADLPQAGDALYISSDEQSVGKIVNASFHPDGGVIVLAVIKIAQAEAHKIHWQNQQGECLQLLDLPYSLTEQ